MVRVLAAGAFLVVFALVGSSTAAGRAARSRLAALRDGVVQERFHYPGVELRSAASVDLAEGVLDRGGGPVRPVVCHGVEAVDDRDDTSRDRDRFSGESGWVAAAVPALVVREGDLLAQSEDCGIGPS